MGVTKHWHRDGTGWGTKRMMDSVDTKESG